jgi:hypothetical protein
MVVPRVHQLQQVVRSGAVRIQRGVTALPAERFLALI